MSFNKIILVGHLGKDPELRYTPQAIPVCNFSVATSERRRDNAGELQEKTTWFRVTTWRKQAELANQYLKKGSLVYIEGRLSLDEWTDRDGGTRASLKVDATDIRFIERKQTEAVEDAGSSEPISHPPAQGSGPEEDVPF